MSQRIAMPIRAACHNAQMRSVIAGLGPAFIPLKTLLRRLTDARASSLIGEAKINASTAFAYNLMGALFGAVMEYNSMYFGFAFLYLLALGFYVFHGHTRHSFEPDP